MKVSQTIANQSNLLVPLDVYLKAGVHLGVKYRTKLMSKFIYKIRDDGLTVLNMDLINKRLKVASKMLARYDPEEILVVCRRENAQKAAKKFAEIIGAEYKVGRYLPGTLTNTNYYSFKEPKVLFTCDTWSDKQAIADAVRSNIPVISLASSNNTTKNVDLIIPCNNKGRKSVSLIYWILAREVLKNRKDIKSNSDFKYKVEDFEK